MTQTTSCKEEAAFAFDCQGDELIGFLHRGNDSSGVGVLTIVAGGPQYRAGVGWGLVDLGRRLSSEGIPVMRFDHRGIGDSEGAFRRFTSMEDDIAAAIDQFKQRAPNVRSVILWGGCDAATSALINAYRFPDVVGVIAGNPFVHSPETSARVARRHYIARLFEASFWVKLAKMEYNIGEYVRAAMRKLHAKNSTVPKGGEGELPDEGDSPFLDDLLTGLQQFKGRVLFLMGSRFQRVAEFDVLVDSSPEWRSAYRNPAFERVDIEDGDQVFSSIASRERTFDAASHWIHRTFAEQV